MSIAVVGIDLGGTKVARRRSAMAGWETPSPARPSEARRCSMRWWRWSRGRAAIIDAVGVGVPSIVEFETGRVVSSTNVPLADVPLREVLGERLGVPVFVDNDATVAALAEAYDEQLRLVTRNLVMITVGTGIGGGLVLDGRIYRGSTGGAASSATRSSAST